MPPQDDVPRILARFRAPAEPFTVYGPAGATMITLAGERHCECGNKLNSYNPGPCHACITAERERWLEQHGESA